MTQSQRATNLPTQCFFCEDDATWTCPTNGNFYCNSHVGIYGANDEIYYIGTDALVSPETPIEIDFAHVLNPAATSGDLIWSEGLDGVFTTLPQYQNRRKFYIGCHTCLTDFKRVVNGESWGGPEHYYSSNCLSGKRPHCTCDICF